MIQSMYVSPSNMLIPTITINLKYIYMNIVKNIEIIMTYTGTMIQNVFLFYTNIETFIIKNKTQILHKYNPTKYIFHKNTYDIIRNQIKDLYNYDKDTYLIIFVLLCCYVIYNINNEILIQRIRRLEKIVHRRSKINKLYGEYN